MSDKGGDIILINIEASHFSTSYRPNIVISANYLIAFGGQCSILSNGMQPKMPPLSDSLEFSNTIKQSAMNRSSWMGHHEAEDIYQRFDVTATTWPQ